jgi:hypothetical protein
MPAGKKSTLLEAGGIAGGREVSIADRVRDLKAGTSRWIHESIPEQTVFTWPNANHAALRSSRNNNCDS